MALIDDIRKSLRVTSNAFDDEVQMLIDAAITDMRRVGVDEAILDEDAEDGYAPLVKQAVTAYAKANFGYDNPEAARFQDTYQRTVCDLLNSSANIAAESVGQ